MAYKNIEELVTEVEKFHPVYLWDDLSNYLSLKDRIEENIGIDNTKTIKDMDSLLSIYEPFTRVFFINDIQKDLLVATTEIEYEYCNRALTGDFKITKKAIEEDFRLVDWYAYHNKNPKNFMEACKKADKIYNINVKEIIEYYEDDSRFNFIEVYPTLYNQRVIGVFDNKDDAYYWGDWHSYVEEIDGLFYVERAGY